MGNLPFVSVVIKVLNGKEYVKSCILSLRNQDYPKDRYEIVVVDNGSRDGTIGVLKEEGVKYYIENKRGHSYALNSGVKNAIGDIIVFTDIDCVPERTWISNIIFSFEDRSVGCVVGEIKLLKERSNNVLNFQERQGYMSPLYGRNFEKFPLQLALLGDGANMALRKTVFNKVGLFDVNFIKSSDTEIVYRMSTQSDFRIVFNKKAVVREPGEPTLKALLDQRIRIGVGQFLIRSKYKELSGPRLSVRRAYWIFRDIFKSIQNVFVLNIKSFFKAIDSDIAYDESIKLLMGLVDAIGRICAPVVLAFRKVMHGH